MRAAGRAVAAVIWVVLATLSATILARAAWPFNVAYLAGWAIISVAETVAILRSAQGDTISNNVTDWARENRLHMLLMVATLSALLAHWVTGFPSLAVSP